MGLYVGAVKVAAKGTVYEPTQEEMITKICKDYIKVRNLYIF